MDHHLQFQIPVMLQGFLFAEMHCLKQILERCYGNPVLWVPENFHETAKKMSKSENNEEGCSMHSASSIFAEPQGENHTQVDHYNIRIHVSVFCLFAGLFFYRVQQYRISIKNKN